MKSEPEFLVKGFGTTPLDFSKLRVEMLLKAPLIQRMCGHTNNIKQVYEY